VGEGSGERALPDAGLALDEDELGTGAVEELQAAHQVTQLGCPPYEDRWVVRLARHVSGPLSR
jgi:hypothetical protein